MNALSRLLRVGSVADSMGAYVPAMALQKVLGLGRVLLFVYLMVDAKAEYGLWGLGMMIFTLAAPLMTFGSNHGLARYVSYYESRGRLHEFLFRSARGIGICALLMLAIGLLASPLIARLLVVRREEAAAAGVDKLLTVCMLAMANAFAMSLHSNMVSVMVGLRAYRLTSATEIFFGVIFTAGGAGVLWLDPTSTMLLIVHLVSLTVSLAAGMLLLYVGVWKGLIAQHDPVRAAAERRAAIIEPHDPTAEIAGASGYASCLPGQDVEEGIVPRILLFGVVAMVGSFLWMGAQYVSFYVTYRWCGEEAAGEYNAFMQFSQPTLFLANAAWAVIFTHVAKHWETGHVKTGMDVLETSYKAIAMAMMTLTVAIYVTARWWVLILPVEFRHGLPLLGGLLTFFQVVIHLAVMTIIAKIRERPSVIGLTALAGIVANVLLILLWMRGDAYLPGEAAWASGAGMFVGAATVSTVYFVVARVKLQPSTLVVMAAPALLLATRWMPVWIMGAAWCAFALGAVLTNAVFNPREKHILSASIKRATSTLRRVVGSR